MFSRKSGFLFIVLALLTLASGVSHAQLVGSVKDVVEPVGSTGRVDWTTGVITAIGIGAPRPSRRTRRRRAPWRSGPRRSSRIEICSKR